MTIISVAIFSRGGSILLARQYVPISTAKIQGILSAFPKLINSAKQHTFVETSEVRYVCQPLDKITLVLVTLKTSNLLEDMDTLKLLARIMPSFCVHRNEDNQVISSQSMLLPSLVVKNAMEITFAFDEVVSVGQGEKLTLAQIHTYLQADSKEERIQEVIAHNKEREAKAVMKQKAMEFREKQRQMDRVQQMQQFGLQNPQQMPGYGSSPQSQRAISSDMSPPPSRSSIPSSLTPSSPTTATGHSGMSLKSIQQPRVDTFMDKLTTEDTFVVPKAGGLSRPGAVGKPEVDDAQPRDAVSVNAIEHLSVILNKDGGMENLELKGELQLIINDESIEGLEVALANQSTKSFQLRTHPNIAKSAYFESGIIKPKDPSRPFPFHTPLPVLKWRFTSSDEGDAPVLVNCWPAPIAGGLMEVNIEYELLKKEMELVDITVYVPLPGSKDPEIKDTEVGDLKYNRKDRLLEWTIPIINESNANGTLVFTLETANQAAFFPVSVRFSSRKLFCEFELISASSGASPDDRTHVSSGFVTRMSTDQYVIT